MSSPSSSNINNQHSSSSTASNQQAFATPLHVDRVLKHAVTLQQTLVALWKDSQLCDVTLVVNGQYYPCHRMLLASTCPYFRVMFASRLYESQNREIVLYHEPEAAFAFERLLLFLYTGRLEVRSESELFAALRMADQYQVRICMSYIYILTKSFNKLVSTFLHFVFVSLFNVLSWIRCWSFAARLWMPRVPQIAVFATSASSTHCPVSPRIFVCSSCIHDCCCCCDATSKPMSHLHD